MWSTIKPCSLTDVSCRISVFKVENDRPPGQARTFTPRSSDRAGKSDVVPWGHLSVGTLVFSRLLKSSLHSNAPKLIRTLSVTFSMNHMIGPPTDHLPTYTLCPCFRFTWPGSPSNIEHIAISKAVQLNVSTKLLLDV